MARLAESAPRLTTGDGSLCELPGILASFGVRRPLVVTGVSSWTKSGANARLRRAVPEFARFSIAAPGPSLADVATGIAILKQSNADAVVGLGGGSAMDRAKIIALMAGQPEPPDSYLSRGKEPLPYRDLPLILIPTTAGSGSEMTRFAAVNVNGRNLCLAHAGLRADHAIVDPTLSATMPPPITAASGLNVLGQSIESYWAVNSTPESREYAMEALDLTLFHLEKVCHDPTMAGRRAMSEAAMLAGRASDVSRPTAPHAVSHLIAADSGLPHGHARGLVLPQFLRFNADVRPEDCADPRGVGFVRARIDELLGCLGAATADAGARSLRNLVAASGLATRLSDLGIDADTIAREGEAEPVPTLVANNPRRLGAEALSGILAAIR